MHIIHFDKITSTQDYALDLIKTNIVYEDTLITSIIQTDGRGRLKQRKWLSEYGNFHGSYIVNIQSLDISINNVSIINTLVMYSIFKFLNRILGKDILKIKLPNDIYYNNKKLAGVLIEIMYPYAIIGIGINIYTSPLHTSTSLYDIIKNNNLVNIYNIFDDNYGLSNKYCNELYEVIVNNLRNFKNMLK